MAEWGIKWNPPTSKRSSIERFAKLQRSFCLYCLLGASYKDDIANKIRWKQNWLRQVSRFCWLMIMIYCVSSRNYPLLWSDENETGVARWITLTRLFVAARHDPLAVTARDRRGFPRSLTLEHTVSGTAPSNGRLHRELLAFDTNWRPAHQFSRPCYSGAASVGTSVRQRRGILCWPSLAGSARLRDLEFGTVTACTGKNSNKITTQSFQGYIGIEVTDIEGPKARVGGIQETKSCQSWNVVCWIRKDHRV